MEFNHWLSLLMLCTLGAMSPGPSLAVIIQVTTRSNRLNGIVAAIAHGLGVGCYALLAAFGIAIVFTQQPLLFNGLKIGGAIFLLFLGLKALGVVSSGKLSAAQLSNKPPVNTNTENFATSFKSGFFIALLNPKVALYFVALFSQFVREQDGLLEKLLMAAIATTVDALWFCLVAVAVSKTQMVGKFAGYGEKIFGLLMIVLAVAILLD